VFEYHLQRGRRFAKSSSPYADVARRQALALAAATLCIRGWRADLGQIRASQEKQTAQRPKESERVLKHARPALTPHGIGARAHATRRDSKREIISR